VSDTPHITHAPRREGSAGGMNHARMGAGRPLLLLHGLGGAWQSWSMVLDALAAEREVIAVDLPGHGATPMLAGETSIATFADAVTAFLDAHGLRGVDVAGSSMGARLVLELARRGVVGAAVSLDPGGFWNGWERTLFGVTIGASIRLVRRLQPAMPALAGSAAGRTLLLAQLSARPWLLPPDVVLREMRAYAAAPAFDPMLASLVHGPEQQGMPAGSATRPMVIAWGRQDRVCLPRQADRAAARFPDARVHWFDACGHFPHWDAPEQTVELILRTTAA